jgi:hypothetical protein
MSDVILRGVLNMPLENSIDIEQRHARILELTKQRDALAEALEIIATHNIVDNQCDNGYSPQYVAKQALAAVKGGSHARD